MACHIIASLFEPQSEGTILHCKTVVFTLIALIAVAAIGAKGQQPAPEEFISIYGRFGVMLPGNYAEHKYIDFTLGEEKLRGSFYRWVLGSDQAMITFAAGSIDFEANADIYLKALRDNYAQTTARGNVIGEKSTSSGGHAGLIFIVENSTGRTMVWTYLIKNRVYLMSMTLNDATRMEEHVQLMSTIRFLSLKDLEPRLAKLVSELTPEPLPQEPANDRPTTDAQDLFLKGPVKTIVTEQEPYHNGLLFGERNLVSLEDFNERGNLVKSVLYLGTLPEAVRWYGTLKGERVFREMRRFPDIVLAGSRPQQKDSVTKAPRPEPKDFKLKYKHDANGQLVEMRVIRPEGKELESFVYNSKKKTIEHTLDPAYGIMAGTFDVEKSKVTSTLDDNGHAIEDAYRVRDGAIYVSRTGPDIKVQGYEPRYKTEKVKYEYELDQRGNWTKRTTFSSTTDKPMAVTYRTITYYQ